MNRPPKIAIIHEDADLTAIDKPPNLSTVSERWDANAPTAISLLWTLWREREKDPPRPHVIHRLDKDTSGVLLFARHRQAQANLRRQFRERSVEKHYLALTTGIPTPPEGTIELSIEKDPARPGRMRVARSRGKACRTDYRVLAVHGWFAWIEVHPHTGRTHQIRISLREAGASCVVDSYYGDGAPVLLSGVKRDYRPGRGETERPLLDRLGLHAASIAIDHPTTGERITFEAPLPKDLRATLRQLERWA